MQAVVAGDLEPIHLEQLVALLQAGLGSEARGLDEGNEAAAGEYHARVRVPVPSHAELLELR